MQQLPNDKNLPIEKLAACFNNTSATYKFYWLLSIVDALEGRIKSESTMIPKMELFARMISNAWYTVNYFHISFGPQDILQRAILEIADREKITIDSHSEEIVKKLVSTGNAKTIQQLQSLDRYVPDRFLSPWFPGKDKNGIYKASNDIRNNCPYSLDKDIISVNLMWANYFIENAALLKDFCYWNLALFLQARNPSVPDIPNKLIKPAVRNSLNKQRKGFWDIVIYEKPNLKCIYTQKPLEVGSYVVEHFVPYSFVSHDLIWNLIPADSSFNSSKSDRLPPLEKYFDSFFSLQRTAIEVMINKKPESKFLEEYLTIFPDLHEAISLNAEFTREKFRERIQPLITIASNNGFEFIK